MAISKAEISSALKTFGWPATEMLGGPLVLVESGRLDGIEGFTVFMIGWLASISSISTWPHAWEKWDKHQPGPESTAGPDESEEK